MSDNTTINPGAGGDIIATDDIAGVKYPRSKLVLGADGVNDGDVSSSNPLPMRQNAGSGTLTGAVINASSSGDNTLVSGTTSQTVRVYRLLLTAAGNVNVKFKDGASTDLTAALTLQAGGAIVLDFDTEPWFVTSAGNGFVLNLSAAVQVSGRVWYVKN